MTIRSPARVSFHRKEQYIAGLDNPEFQTTSAIVDDLRIRVYSDAAVVTGRATYQVGLRSAEGTLTASGLPTPSSGVTAFGNV